MIYCCGGDGTYTHGASTHHIPTSHSLNLSVYFVCFCYTPVVSLSVSLCQCSLLRRMPMQTVDVRCNLCFTYAHTRHTSTHTHAEDVENYNRTDNRTHTQNQPQTNERAGYHLNTHIFTNYTIYKMQCSLMLLARINYTDNRFDTEVGVDVDVDGGMVFFFGVQKLEQTKTKG